MQASSFRHYGPFLVLALALTETFAHFVARSRVPDEEDYRRAAARVQAELREDDAVLMAPSWASPLLAAELGGAMGARRAGFSDLAAFDRVWVVSIRGREPPAALGLTGLRPSVDETHGRTRVRRFDLEASSVRYDFVDHLATAEVSIGEGEGARRCRFGASPEAPGGLGTGPMTPRERFVCPSNRWVGETVLEPLDLQPRRCVYQHPARGEPVDVAFRGVGMGQRIVVYAGLDYHDERDGVGEPFTLSVLVDGEVRGAFEHHDGDGWARYEVDTRAADATTAEEVVFRVTGDSPRRRSVCWAATVRGQGRGNAESPR